MSAAKLERLLNLTALLLNTPRPLSAQEIRDRIEAYPADLAAFRRAFERALPAASVLVRQLVVQHHEKDPHRFFIPVNVEDDYSRWIRRELARETTVLL